MTKAELSALIVGNLSKLGARDAGVRGLLEDVVMLEERGLISDVADGTSKEQAIQTLEALGYPVRSLLSQVDKMRA